MKSKLLLLAVLYLVAGCNTPSKPPAKNQETTQSPAPRKPEKRWVISAKQIQIGSLTLQKDSLIKVIGEGGTPIKIRTLQKKLLAKYEEDISQLNSLPDCNTEPLDSLFMCTPCPRDVGLCCTKNLTVNDSLPYPCILSPVELDSMPGYTMERLGDCFLYCTNQFLRPSKGSIPLSFWDPKTKRKVHFKIGN